MWWSLETRKKHRHSRQDAAIDQNSGVAVLVVIVCPASGQCIDFGWSANLKYGYTPFQSGFLSCCVRHTLCEFKLLRESYPAVGRGRGAMIRNFLAAAGFLAVSVAGVNAADLRIHSSIREDGTLDTLVAKYWSK